MTHSSFCEADTGHALDCATATELAKLRAFAEAVRDEFDCETDKYVSGDPGGCGDVDDCWHCYAAAVLEPAK